MTSNIRFSLALVAILLAPTSGTPQGTALTAEQAKAIARDAYVFAYPLVMNYRTMYMQAIKGDGPSGHFSLYIRAYWGQPGILDGSWRSPVIRKVTQG